MNSKLEKTRQIREEDIPGVYYNPDNNLYHTFSFVNLKFQILGDFETLEEAQKVYADSKAQQLPDLVLPDHIKKTINTRDTTELQTKHYSWNRNTKGYSWNRNKNKFQCYIFIDSKRINLGYASSIEEARHMVSEGRIKHSEDPTLRFSKIKGYTYDKVSQKFKAQIRVNNKSIHLGLFETEAEARQAYLDAKLKSIDDPTFEYSKIKGYAFDKRAGKYRATIRINKTFKHIGYFETEAEAHRAYLEAKKILINQ